MSLQKLFPRSEEKNKTYRKATSCVDGAVLSHRPLHVFGQLMHKKISPEKRILCATSAKLSLNCAAFKCCTHQLYCIVLLQTSRNGTKCLFQIFLNCFCWSNESNQKAIRDRSSKVEILDVAKELMDTREASYSVQSTPMLLKWLIFWTMVQMQGMNAFMRSARLLAFFMLGAQASPSGTWTSYRLLSTLDQHLLGTGMTSTAFRPARVWCIRSVHGQALETRSEDLKLLRCLIRPSLRGTRSKDPFFLAD